MFPYISCFRTNSSGKRILPGHFPEKVKIGCNIKIKQFHFDGRKTVAWRFGLRDCYYLYPMNGWLFEVKWERRQKRMKNSEMGRIHSFRSATMKLQRLIHCHLERVIHIEPCNGKLPIRFVGMPWNYLQSTDVYGFHWLWGYEQSNDYENEHMHCIQQPNQKRCEGGWWILLYPL